jgi:ferredoxin-type protein NapF
MVTRRQFLRGDLSARRPAGDPAAPASAKPVAHIAPHCLANDNAVCRSCGDACPVNAIRFRPRLGGAALPEIDTEKCTACGDCVAPCPVAAVTIS